MTSKNYQSNTTSAFWDAFFFMFGFGPNPFLKKAREIKRGQVEDRIGESWARTSGNFNAIYNRESCLMHE